MGVTVTSQQTSREVLQVSDDHYYSNVCDHLTAWDAEYPLFNSH